MASPCPWRPLAPFRSPKNTDSIVAAPLLPVTTGKICCYQSGNWWSFQWSLFLPIFCYFCNTFYGVSFLTYFKIVSFIYLMFYIILCRISDNSNTWILTGINLSLFLIHHLFPRVLVKIDLSFYFNWWKSASRTLSYKKSCVCFSWKPDYLIYPEQHLFSLSVCVLWITLGI